MKLKEFATYDTVLEYLKIKGRVKNLLFGNGFSIAFDPNIFSYNALAREIDEGDDNRLKKVFKTLGSQNFELAMKHLKIASQLVADLDGPPDFRMQIEEVHKRLKNALIGIISKNHPDNIFSIQSKAEACARFLKCFLDPYERKNEKSIPGGHVFSTNYDLLLYWVVMSQLVDSRNGNPKYCDGFAYENSTRERLIWGYNKDTQNIHYLHGTLPVFQRNGELEKLKYDGKTLIENILARIRNEEYPLFVAAGTKDEKKTQIAQSGYLRFCYEKLCSIKGSLVVIGFGFGENDDHIIDAINKAASQKGGEKLHSVYIGYFGESDKAHLKEIQRKFKCGVRLFPSSTVKIWGN